MGGIEPTTQGTQDTQDTVKQRLLEKDRKHLWHHMSVHSDDPMIFVSGEGCWLTDIDGNRYFDAMSGLWCVNIGHGRKEMAAAAAKQMELLAYVPLSHSHVPAIELASKISGWLGGEYRIFFSNSGSDANEVAFKIARQYYDQIGQPNRYKFISRHRAYHGNSMGALGATGQAQRKFKYEPLGTGFQHVPPPYCYRCPFGKSTDSCRMECAGIYDQVIQWEGPETVAGLIVEPVITGGGMIVPPPGYLKKVKEICDKHGVLLIVDEVICGFGRSGEKFGHCNYGVGPDIVTMAKGLTSAYAPLSATAVRADLYDSFRERSGTDHFRHVNTFGGNPLSCAVALKNMEILEDEKLIQASGELGRRLSERLLGLSAHRTVGDIRTFGFAAGIELVEDKETKRPASAENVAKVIESCKQRGLLIGKNGDTVPGYANVLTLAPPFVTTPEEVDWMASTLEIALNTLPAGDESFLTGQKRHSEFDGECTA
ncbi:aminotransferase [Paenibacillus darwinianus]|uniref:Aminotransferase n=1 Tax=Paenibacillus darwinianus TaxID=1380763 RepID=A0A9W5RYU2_9BACL|nr:aspartate aminotransferase family protein [Paenibacillus darwinianus]EXX85014.1 aminotransferase [Paenibacillus darwinianus]EXX86236.1 aminotransferase [Paenibacillus darwinianus]EXX86652.1 aminotransferase [Paenibacillus darwinianus]